MTTTMAPLIFMYVFFDKDGEIKAIAPTLDESLSTSYAVASFPLSEVEMFLTAQKNAFDYRVIRTEKPTGTVYRIAKKQVDVSYVRTLDAYLTKIEDANIDTTLIVTNNLGKKYVSLELSREFRNTYEQYTDDGSVVNFFNCGSANIYITKKNNPYHLLFTINFAPRSLLVTDILYFNYTEDYNDISAYSKKLINGYGFRVKAE